MNEAVSPELASLRATIRHLENLVSEAQRTLGAASLILSAARAEFCQYPILLPPDLSEGTNHED